MPTGTPTVPAYILTIFPFKFAVLFRFAGDQWKIAGGAGGEVSYTFLG